MKTRSIHRPAVFVLVIIVLVTTLGVPMAVQGSTPKPESAIFFVSDGMRQDLVESYASQGLLPTMNSLLQNGAKAADGGLLTQAPPNTGAGWYSLATGAWPGVHGSTNNTFAINGAPFANRTGSFDTGVLQAETLAQAAERGGKKVAQIEWAGGRRWGHQRPNSGLHNLPVWARSSHELHQLKR